MCLSDKQVSLEGNDIGSILKTFPSAHGSDANPSQPPAVKLRGDLSNPRSVADLLSLILVPLHEFITLRMP